MMRLLTKHYSLTVFFLEAMFKMQRNGVTVI